MYGAHKLDNRWGHRGIAGQTYRARAGPWPSYRHHHPGDGGASLGGFAMGVLGGSGTTSFDVWTVLVATLGAILLLYLYALLVRRTV